MNIFYLDSDPLYCACLIRDKDIKQLIVDGCHILSTAHRVLDGDKHYNFTDHRETIFYKALYPDHPWNVWARSSSKNYMWLSDHMKHVARQYYMRFGKIHTSTGLIWIFNENPPFNLKIGHLLPAPVVVPNDKFLLSTPVESYRAYYESLKDKT